jgi:putrescine transport system substrate-binding protein
MRGMTIVAILRRLCLVGLALAVLPPGARAEEARLHIYNWSDYIAPDTVANFEKETGISVTYDVYDGNEVLEAKLLAGRSGYDIVVPSASPYMARQIAAGAYLPLDKSKLPNLKNLDPRLVALAATADPGNRHGVPYLWSVTGIGYNVAKVARALGEATPRESLALLFDPAHAAKLAGCGIELLDTPQEVVPAALAYLGIDPTSRDLADLDRAVALLEQVRPYVRRFHSSQYINDLAAGDICVALGYSGDVIQARNRASEAESGVEIAFRVPREGAQMSTCLASRPTRRTPTTRTALSTISCAPMSSRRSATRCPTRTRTGRRRRSSNRRFRATPGSIRRMRCSVCCTSTGRRRAPTSGRGCAPGTG